MFDESFTTSIIIKEKNDFILYFNTYYNMFAISKTGYGNIIEINSENNLNTAAAAVKIFNEITGVL